MATMHLGSRSGSALIQVIVASAIMAVLFAATASMISQQTASIGFLEDSLSRAALETELTNVFSNGVSCTQNLSGAVLNTPTAQSAFVLTDSTGQVLYNPSAGQNGKFNQLQLSASVKNTSVAGPGSTGNALITVNVSRIRSGGGPQVLKPLTFNTQVTVDGNSKVISCGGVSNGACLDNVAQLIWTGGVGSIVVPASAKVIQIQIPSGSQTNNGHNNGGNGGGGGWTCAWGGGSVVIHLGVSKVNGVVLQPGKTLQFSNAGVGTGTQMGTWIYDGQTIASGPTSCGPTASGQPIPWQFNVVPGGSVGATCPSTPFNPPMTNTPNKTLSPGFAVVWQ